MRRISSCAAFLATILLACVFAGAQAKRPNVIAIVTDDQAKWTLGCYGNRECQTPNMDRIAREGARFNNAFVVTPVCSPSRTSFFTGRYGTELGITDWINQPQAKAGVGLDRAMTWPKALQQNGYVTALIGKWHLGEGEKSLPANNGFTHFYGFLGGGASSMNPMLDIDGKKVTVEGCTADVIADGALKFIESNKDKPVGLCLMFREPHQPYDPVPSEDSAPYEKLDPTVPNLPFLDQAWTKDRTRKYYGSIHAADRNVGRVLKLLDDLKLAENTLILFTSDHGYNIGHHGIYTKGNAAWVAGGVHGPKRPNMFEESIRVPLLVRYPAVVKAGSVIDDMVANIDTFATILGALGIAMPDGLKQHGVDFSPLLRGESMPRRDAVFAQFDLHNAGLAFMRMIRTERWKLVRHHFANGLNELYDLQNDPGETKNLYLDNPSRNTRDELQARLTAWQQSIDDPILTNPLEKRPGVGPTSIRP